MENDNNNQPQWSDMVVMARTTAEALESMSEHIYELARDAGFSIEDAKALNRSAPARGSFSQTRLAQVSPDLLLSNAIRSKSAELAVLEDELKETANEGLQNKKQQLTPQLELLKKLERSIQIQELMQGLVQVSKGIESAQSLGELMVLEQQGRKYETDRRSLERNWQDNKNELIGNIREHDKKSILASALAGAENVATRSFKDNLVSSSKAIHHGIFGVIEKTLRMDTTYFDHHLGREGKELTEEQAFVRQAGSESEKREYLQLSDQKEFLQDGKAVYERAKAMLDRRRMFLEAEARARGESAEYLVDEKPSEIKQKNDAIRRVPPIDESTLEKLTGALENSFSGQDSIGEVRDQLTPAPSRAGTVRASDSERKARRQGTMPQPLDLGALNMALSADKQATRTTRRQATVLSPLDLDALDKALAKHSSNTGQEPTQQASFSPLPGAIHDESAPETPPLSPSTGQTRSSSRSASIDSWPATPQSVPSSPIFSSRDSMGAHFDSAMADSRERDMRLLGIDPDKGPKQKSNLYWAAKQVTGGIDDAFQKGVKRFLNLRQSSLSREADQQGPLEIRSDQNVVGEKPMIASHFTSEPAELDSAQPTLPKVELPSSDMSSKSPSPSWDASMSLATRRLHPGQTINDISTMPANQLGNAQVYDTLEGKPDHYAVLNAKTEGKGRLYIATAPAGMFPNDALVSIERRHTQDNKVTHTMTPRVQQLGQNAGNSIKRGRTV